jgi:hypothetical protein
MDIENTQSISTMKLRLIEKSLDIYFKMGQCPDSVRAELLAEIQPRIQALVHVRVEKTLVVDSYVMEETIKKKNFVRA